MNAPLKHSTKVAPVGKPLSLGLPELRNALGMCRTAFVGVGMFSAVINILMLTGALFMLQIYDRVLPSGSLPTLIALGLLALCLFATQGLLDLLRGRILMRAGMSIDETMRGRVLEVLLRVPLIAGNQGTGAQPVRDLENLRTFMSGPGLAALFDLPWIPFYLVIIFAFHSALGFTALAGAALLIGITILAEVWSRSSLQKAGATSVVRNNFAETCRRNAEVVAAMGMMPRLKEKWDDINQSHMASLQRANDLSSGFGACARVLRMVLQSSVLAVGAYLVIKQEATAGIIIASAILAGRALAPVDLMIAHSKGFSTARQSWRRLNTLLSLAPVCAEPMALARPSIGLELQRVSAAPPDTRKRILHNITLQVSAGQALGIVGPTGSGKSTLLRVIVGVWRPLAGRICLDGSDLRQWSPEILGRDIGYIPQDVELFAGTIAENISRFEAEAEASTIVAAAKASGVHDLVVAMPEGYETQIGEQGEILSAGQRQRIALARALYRDPFLVVLDEPNSNLDSEGERALNEAISSVRKRGGIVVIVAHQLSALRAVDNVAVLHEGQLRACGPKDEILTAVAPSHVRPGPPGTRRVPVHIVGEKTGT